jgi:hypothetical protein
VRGEVADSAAVAAEVADSPTVGGLSPWELPPGRWLVRWAPALTVAVTTVVVILAVGTAVTDLLRYAVYLGWAVVLPGTLVYRALRARPHSLVDDLAMGSAVGLCLEMVAYLGFFGGGRLFGVDARPGIGLWPTAVVGVFLATPRLRRHWRIRDRDYRHPPTWWSWAVASTVIVVLGYLEVVFLRPNQPVPVDRPGNYFIDQLFYLALAGETRNHFPPHTPWVAAQPLAYHWFAFAHMAMGQLISDVDTPVILFRLAPSALCVLGPVLLAVAGWRISGRPAVGAVAAALTYLVGELSVGSLAYGPLGGISLYMLWGSQSLVYATVITVALLTVLVDRLDRRAKARLGRGGWVLAALFAAASPGAKSSILPVLGCGVALVWTVRLVRRRRHRIGAVTAAAGLLVAGELVGMVVLYRGTSQGIRVSPLSIIAPYLVDSPHQTVLVRIASYVGVLLAYLVFMFARLAGVPALASLRRGRWGDREWLLLGTVAGGAVLTLSLSHPSWSQNFFLRSGWPAGAILSAMGLVAVLDRYRFRPRTVAVVVAATITVASVLSVAIAAVGGGADRLRAHGIAPIASIVATLVVVWLAAVLVIRRTGARGTGLAALVTLVLALDAGAPTLVWDMVANPNGGGRYLITVTPARAAAARWLRAHSDPGDVLATTDHCVRPAPARCYSLSYWLSAFAERRVLVESWGYTAAGMADAARLGRLPGLVPFDRPTLLARNDAAILAPTADRIDWLWRQGVRWIVVDRHYAREPAALAQDTTLRLDLGDVAVYQLRTPDHPKE